jgi:hypothetical protein
MDWVERIRISFAAGVLLLLVTLVYGESQHPISRPQDGKGKIFEYTATRFGIPILKAILKIEDGSVDQGKPFLQIHAYFHSLDYLGLIFRMNNRFTSTVDAETCSPVRYVKEIDQEGLLIKKKHYFQTLTFDSSNEKVVLEKKDEREKQEVYVPPGTHDPLSMFARFYLKEDLQSGQDIRMSIYDGVKLREMVFHSKRDKVKSKIYGEVEAMRLESTTSFSTFGEKEGIMRIWYIENGGKTPILMQLDLPIGDVKFELDEVKEG